MPNAKAALDVIDRLHAEHFGTQEQQALARQLAEERVRAECEMSRKFANLHMPEDIRSRARTWGMEAYCEVLWNNAFQAGYREALRTKEARDDA